MPNTNNSAENANENKKLTTIISIDNTGLVKVKLNNDIIYFSDYSSLIVNGDIKINILKGENQSNSNVKYNWSIVDIGSREI